MCTYSAPATLPAAPMSPGADLGPGTRCASTGLPTGLHRRTWSELDASFNDVCMQELMRPSGMLQPAAGGFPAQSAQLRRPQPAWACTTPATQQTVNEGFCQVWDVRHCCCPAGTACLLEAPKLLRVVQMSKQTKYSRHLGTRHSLPT